MYPDIKPFELANIDNFELLEILTFGDFTPSVQLEHASSTFCMP
jgi:hypothetical protein